MVPILEAKFLSYQLKLHPHAPDTPLTAPTTQAGSGKDVTDPHEALDLVISG